MDMVSVMIVVVLLVCVGVILGFMCVCLESECVDREKRDALRRNGRSAKIFPLEHHEDGRRAA